MRIATNEKCCWEGHYSVRTTLTDSRGSFHTSVDITSAFRMDLTCWLAYLIVFESCGFVYFPDHLRSSAGDMLAKLVMLGDGIRALGHQTVLDHREHIHGDVCRLVGCRAGGRTPGSGYLMDVFYPLLKKTRPVRWALVARDLVFAV